MDKLRHESHSYHMEDGSENVPNTLYFSYILDLINN